MPTVPGGIAFVDLASDFIELEDVVSELQEVAQHFAHVDYVVIRWHAVSTWAPEDVREESTTEQQAVLADRVADRFRALGRTSPVPVAIVRFRVGMEAVVQWSSATPHHVRERTAALLARARAVEFRTLIAWGGAIWQPSGYHYELPSGDHAGAFIRVADVFREPRDVRVVASWLARELRDESAVLVDSATLTPLVIDLQALQAARGWDPGETETLDEYPRTRLDVLRVVRRVARSSGRVLSVLSVNSSGALRDLMHSALESAVGPLDNWSLAVLVDKSKGAESRAYPAPVSDVGDAVESWWVLSSDELGTHSQSACPFCRQSDRAHHVRIDPRSYEAMAITGDDLVMPSFVTGQDGARFREAVNRADAIGYEVVPKAGDSALGRPKSSLMGLRVYFDQLLANDVLRDAVRDRLRHRVTRDRLAAMEPPTAVIVHPDEAQIPGFDDVVGAITRGLGWRAPEIIRASPDAVATMDMSRHKIVTILALGAVTGRMLRLYLEAVQHAWKGLERTIQGLVVHARPNSHREWENWRSSYGKRLDALWLTCLPWRSIVAEELELIARAGLDERHLSQSARDFLSERRSIASLTDLPDRLEAFADGVPGDPRSILWGGPPRGTSDRLTNRSLYGYELGMPAAIAAIGAAIHWRRIEARPNDPRRRMIEMPAVVRSYYDAIIIGSVLRWIEPSEAWWGRSDAEAFAAIDDLLSKVPSVEDQTILYPELILAAAMGKLPRPAAVHLRKLVVSLAADWDNHRRAPLDVALALLDSASG